MRRTVVRLIAKREIRDLLRDRRTLLIVLGLPALLYPAFVVVGLAFAVSLMDQKTVIGVVGADRRWDDPALFADGHFNPKLLKADAAASTLVIRPLDSDDRGPLNARE